MQERASALQRHGHRALPDPRAEAAGRPHAGAEGGGLPAAHREHGPGHGAGLLHVWNRGRQEAGNVLAGPGVSPQALH